MTSKGSGLFGNDGDADRVAEARAARAGGARHRLGLCHHDDILPVTRYGHRWLLDAD